MFSSFFSSLAMSVNIQELNQVFLLGLRYYTQWNRNNPLEVYTYRRTHKTYNMWEEAKHKPCTYRLRCKSERLASNIYECDDGRTWLLGRESERERERVIKKVPCVLDSQWSSKRSANRNKVLQPCEIGDPQNNWSRRLELRKTSDMWFKSWI